MQNQSGLKRDLQAFLKRNAEILPMTFLYTQKEWNARNEPYFNSSPFVLTTEDALYDDLNYGECHYFLVNQLHALAERNGYYYEQGYSWCIGFYSNDF